MRACTLLKLLKHFLESCDLEAQLPLTVSLRGPLNVQLNGYRVVLSTSIREEKDKLWEAIDSHLEAQ